MQLELKAGETSVSPAFCGFGWLFRGYGAPYFTKWRKITKNEE
jgi:hypothetical protein